MAIELTGKTPLTAETLPSGGLFIMHVPDAEGDARIVVLTAVEMARYMTDEGLVGYPSLPDASFTALLAEMPITAAEDTELASVDDAHQSATLSVSPTGYWKLTNGVIVRGATPLSLAGDYNVSVTQTLSGAPNSPKTNTTTIPVVYETQEIGDRWGLDIFPEWFAAGYFKEDVPAGAIAEWTPRGVWASSLVATQATASLRPVRGATGVLFPTNSAATLSLPGFSDNLQSIRWFLLIFRTDASSIGEASAQDHIVSINDQASGSPGFASPRVSYFRNLGYRAIYPRWTGRDTGGSRAQIHDIRNQADDGVTWDCLLGYRRNGICYANLNGVESETILQEKTLAFTHAGVEGALAGKIGSGVALSVSWEMDSLVLGHSELTEAMVDKIMGWAMHRVGRQADLPDGHPYETDHPLVDAEDFPERYEFDEAAWDTWTAASDAVRLTNQGGTRVTPAGFERVFLDDFRVNSVVSSESAAGALDAIWYAPGWNTSIGKTAQNVPPETAPDCYVHNVDETLTLNLAYHTGSGTWRAGTIQSTTNSGQGRSWEGPFIARVRFRLLDVADPIPTGFFHCPLWFYSLLAVHWRTEERIEIDVLEPEGNDRDYLGGLSVHVHEGKRGGYFDNLADGFHHKVWGGLMTEAQIDVPGGYDFWDGEWHTWEIVVDTATTYVNATVDKGSGEEWIEMLRTPTTPELLVRKYILADVALRSGTPTPDTGELHGMDFDFFEVLQKTTQVESYAAPFTARPTLSGTAQVAQVLTCTPNMTGISDIWYYWYADDYPRGFSQEPTYTVDADDEGAVIRCMVKAIGAINQPEAWTDVTAAVIAA